MNDFELEKVYIVEFMGYTSVMNDTVSNGSSDISQRQYLHVGYEPFLVRESDLDKYSGYGGGYRKITFVGNIERRKE